MLVIFVILYVYIMLKNNVFNITNQKKNINIKDIFHSTIY